MKKFVFDIETAPLPETDIAMLSPAFEAPANYKDPVKIADHIQQQRAAWLERAALSPLTGSVCAWGWRHMHDPDHWGLCLGAAGDSEVTLLGKCWDWVRENYVHANFIGFNTHKFDLPFLIRRSWKLGVPIPLGVREGRWFSNNFIDLAEIWAIGNREERISLDTLAKYLGVGVKNGNGADFHKQPLNIQHDYLRNDLDLTARCAAKLL